VAALELPLVPLENKSALNACLILTALLVMFAVLTTLVVLQTVLLPELRFLASLAPACWRFLLLLSGFNLDFKGTAN